MLVDDIVLARISEPAGHVGRSAIAHRSAAGPTIAPILAPTHGGAAMALAGRF